MSKPIPQPPAVPFLGNVKNIDSELPIRSYFLLAQQYGEIYQLNLIGELLVLATIYPSADACDTGRRVIMCNSYALQAELSDDKRFKKVVRGPLNEVRHATGDGLFTSVHHSFLPYRCS
jgi:cytochrome P450/NADPH-cytochrome P450 reductase